MDYSRPDLADKLAADYVSGTLRGHARKRLESLLPAHPVLRSAVHDWQARLAPLTTSIAPLRPPAAVWNRIEARIGHAANTTGSAVQRHWWQRTPFWQGVSGLATAAVLGMAVLLGNPSPAGAPIIVVLSAATPPVGSPQAGVIPASFVASISADGRALTTKPLSTVPMQADRSLELWAVPAAGAPRSLGVISAAGATVVRRSKALDDTAALAVSLEPPGGSPSGAPTGPVLYVGKLGT